MKILIQMKLALVSMKISSIQIKTRQKKNIISSENLNDSIQNFIQLDEEISYK
jgi:hypothetical protein